MPVILDDDLIGVVSVGRNVPGPFDEGEVELVKTFTDQAAIAIANARLLDTVERQRTELSRFLPPQVAALVSSGKGSGCSRATAPTSRACSRTSGLHCLRRDGRARRTVRIAPPIS